MSIHHIITLIMMTTLWITANAKKKIMFLIDMSVLFGGLYLFGASVAVHDWIYKLFWSKWILRTHTFRQLTHICCCRSSLALASANFCCLTYFFVQPFVYHKDDQLKRGTYTYDGGKCECFRKTSFNTELQSEFSKNFVNTILQQEKFMGTNCVGIQF